MVSNNFFLKKNLYNSDLFQNKKVKKKIKINNIKSLVKAGKFDLTFYDSRKYKDFAENTKAEYCITTEKLSVDLPASVKKIVVKI